MSLFHLLASVSIGGIIEAYNKINSNPQFKDLLEHFNELTTVHEIRAKLDLIGKEIMLFDDVLKAHPNAVEWNSIEHNYYIGHVVNHFSDFFEIHYHRNWLLRIILHDYFNGVVFSLRNHSPSVTIHHVYNCIVDNIAEIINYVLKNNPVTETSNAILAFNLISFSKSLNVSKGTGEIIEVPDARNPVPRVPDTRRYSAPVVIMPPTRLVPIDTKSFGGQTGGQFERYEPVITPNELPPPFPKGAGIRFCWGPHLKTDTKVANDVPYVAPPPSTRRCWGQNFDTKKVSIANSDFEDHFRGNDSTPSKPANPTKPIVSTANSDLEDYFRGNDPPKTSLTNNINWCGTELPKTIDPTYLANDWNTFGYDSTLNWDKSNVQPYSTNSNLENSNQESGLIFDVLTLPFNHNKLPSDKIIAPKPQYPINTDLGFDLFGDDSPDLGFDLFDDYDPQDFHSPRTINDINRLFEPCMSASTDLCPLKKRKNDGEIDDEQHKKPNVTNT